MTAALKDVFADTAYWLALVVKQDQLHQRARQWSLRIAGRIITTIPVLLETANALSKPAWRSHCVALINHLFTRSDIVIFPLTSELWHEGWQLYSDRTDKSWSLTDCVSFLIMKQEGLTHALTADRDFSQAGFQPLLCDDPEPR